MKKIYFLSTCSTCIRIMKELPLDSFEKQDIKSHQITKNQLEEMKVLSGDFESLFNRRSMKYRSLDLANKNLKEEDYKNYILEEYTFLKRPVFVVDNDIFIGNSKKVVAALQERLMEK